MRHSLEAVVTELRLSGGVADRVRREARAVVVLTRQGCHLCDEAIAHGCGLREIGEAYAVLDVDGDPELQRRYTDQVPVTFVDGAQHDFWRVDPARLKAALLRSG